MYIHFTTLFIMKIKNSCCCIVRDVNDGVSEYKYQLILEKAVLADDKRKTPYRYCVKQGNNSIINEDFDGKKYSRELYVDQGSIRQEGIYK